MKLIDLISGITKRRGERRGSAPGADGQCFPESGGKVPYPNPHPDGKTGSFPDAPKPPKKPTVSGGLGF